MNEARKKQIGQLLIDAGIITEDQIEIALSYKQEHQVYMGEAIIALGYLSEKELATTLSDQLDIPYLELNSYQIQNESLEIINEPFARENHIIPLFFLGDELTVAIADPLNINLVDELSALGSNIRVNLILSTKSEIDYAIDLYYGASKYLATGQNDRDQQEGVRVVSKELDKETRAVEAINNFLNEAVKIGASDIHIEPREKDVRIRFRVDGVLQQYYTIPLERMNSLISRVKILSDMDIAESRKPQDGRFTYRENNIRVDLRTSTFPTPNGEKVVMRILDEKRGRIELNKLGFSERMFKQWRSVIKHPDGIVLVSGPTGSGKTTTLYSTLNLINSVEINIMTVEDPIEYVLENINQCQVNPQAGVTFPLALRTMLRQDPDVILVGEMRDTETIELAIRAALTGHLVFSTIHTNDAASCFTRLLDMGIDSYLVTSTVRAILAQKLIRLLCPQCKKPIEATAHVMEALGIDKPDGPIFEPKGCIHCRNSGYMGRSGVFELLEPNDEIRKMILERSTSMDIEEKAVQSGMITLKSAVIEYVKDGRTSYSEFARVMRG
ncbi:MAG: Flp pilus assembly complex ATPase component TadA [Candidatus Marinimicrobia bacterium]|nr:Flp pilus assembly complex ATPase component TadA [Candidatus Neomarinimicrobiota bacterium]MCH7764192.1 Flp pilus assembly complex ATPase component TadA [Candidatus Neomarinimicrobiota bacterium]